MDQDMRAEQYLKGFFDKVTLEKIMNSNFVSLYKTDKLSSAQRKFLDNKTSHIIVKDSDERLAGLLSQKYLFKTKSPRRIVAPEQMSVDREMMLDKDTYYDKEMLDSYPVANVMHKTPSTLNLKDTLATAIRLMSERNIDCIVIISDSKQVKGVLTHKEILDYISIVISSN